MISRTEKPTASRMGLTTDFRDEDKKGSQVTVTLCDDNRFLHVSAFHRTAWFNLKRTKVSESEVVSSEIRGDPVSVSSSSSSSSSSLASKKKGPDVLSRML